MSLIIEWSPRASFEYREIIDYILESFGEAAADRFDRHVEEVLGLVIQFPGMYPESEEKKGVYGP